MYRSRARLEHILSRNVDMLPYEQSLQKQRMSRHWRLTLAITGSPEASYTGDAAFVKHLLAGYGKLSEKEGKKW